MFKTGWKECKFKKQYNIQKEILKPDEKNVSSKNNVNAQQSNHDSKRMFKTDKKMYVLNVEHLLF